MCRVLFKYPFVFNSYENRNERNKAKQSNPYPHMENQKKEVTKRAIEINAEIKMTSL